MAGKWINDGRSHKWRRLYEDDWLEIIEHHWRRTDIPGSKWQICYYANFRNGRTIDFYTKKELKEFIKSRGIEKEFSNRFLKTA